MADRKNKVMFTDINILGILSISKEFYSTLQIVIFGLKLSK